MYSRALRLTCGVVALIAIGAATFLLIRSEQDINQQTASLRAFDQLARDATAALVDARVSQQAYVAAGQGVEFWFNKTGGSLQSAKDGLAALRVAAGAAAGTSVDQAAATVEEFSALDKRARDYLASGDQLMAGDVIFTEGSDAAATAVRQMETARQAQHQAADADMLAVRKQEQLAAAGAATVVLLVVLLLIPVPRAKSSEATQDTGVSIASRVVEPTIVSIPAPAPTPTVTARVTTNGSGSVFKAATDVVTDFARVRTLEDLTAVLGRAAEVMDASGVMVWMGTPGGADLRPALAYGYSEEMLARIPPVPRSADNAAAAAYRSGTLQTVRSHPGGASGAVVAPILSPDGCIGALSAEIRSGGETSESVTALASIFAAQLAAVLAPAPAPAPAVDMVEPRAAANS